MKSALEQFLLSENVFMICSLLVPPPFPPPFLPPSSPPPPPLFLFFIVVVVVVVSFPVDTALGMLHLPSCLCHRVKLLTQLLCCYTNPSCLCPFCKDVQTALEILPSCLCPLCEAVDTVLGVLHLPIVYLPIV